MVLWIEYLFGSLSDIILKVRPVATYELQKIRDHATLISFLYPAQNQDLIKELAAKKLNAFGKLTNTFLRIIC